MLGLLQKLVLGDLFLKALEVLDGLFEVNDARSRKLYQPYRKRLDTLNQILQSFLLYGAHGVEAGREEEHGCHVVHESFHFETLVY